MKIYVTGASGLLGSNVVRVAHARGHDVFAALHRNRLPDAMEVEQAPVDLTDPQAVARSLSEVRPDAIVHSAYLPGLERIENDPQAAKTALVDASATLARAARNADVPMALVSTDFVFDGRSGPYQESDGPNPVNRYGVLKVIAETAVRTLWDAHLVTRVAGLFGPAWADPERTGSQDRGFGFLVNETIATLREGRPYTVWNGGATLNEWATPTLASDAAATILGLLERGASGTFHAVGGEHAERADLARAAATAFDLPTDGIVRGPIPSDRAGIGRDLVIPRDTRLASEVTVAASGVPARPLHAMLADYRRQLETGALS